MRRAATVFVLALVLVLARAQSGPLEAEEAMTAEDVDRFARLALECLHREYPNKIAHVLDRDEDVRPPRELTPVFYGCFDWHSAVHAHWLLARVARKFPGGPFVDEARAALTRSFTADAVAGEVEYLSRRGRETFERPYGLAWLLQLCVELEEWNDPESRAWLERLEPLESLAVSRFLDWLPKLEHPIRTGEHSQTAFAMGLVLDWARARGHRGLEALVEKKTREYYGEDRGWSFAFEPGGQDFLSPGLAEADLLRRVLEPAAFAAWLRAFAPELDDDDEEWIAPVRPTDRSDGKLAHLDGLNLSRAWMLEGIAEGLPGSDPRQERLRRVAARHREAGLAAVTGEFYEGGHWLGTFAVYLVTRRGI